MIPVILCFQQIPVSTSPIYLGPTGTIILVTACILLGFLAFRQRNWKTTADASSAELVIQRGTSDRLREEKLALQKEKDLLKEENIRLHAQTDLKPLVTEITNWISEGRGRFDEATKQLTQTRDAQDKGLRELFAEVSANRRVSEEAFRTYTTTFVQHVEEDRLGWTKLLAMFATMEQRLNQTAIQVGRVKWDTPSASQPESTHKERTRTWKSS